MADSDEKIRAVLDLGDSSSVVKKLNEEIDRLLGEFKKLTEGYEKGTVSQKDFLEGQKKLRGEIHGVSQSMEQLKKAPEASAGIEQLGRAMFALERGSSALIMGTGLGRAAGMLESVIAFANGPAGIGIALGLIANTIDNVAPKIKASWDKVWNQFSDEQIALKKGELAAKAASLRDAVSAMTNAPAPGMEFQEAERTTKLKGIFNAETMRGPGGIPNALFEAIKKHEGATPTDQSPEETEELKRLSDIVNPERASKEAYDQGGILGYTMHALSTPVQGPRTKQAAQLEINKIKSAIARRSADQLIMQAQQPGPAGKIARKQLLDLAKRHEGVLSPDDIQKLEDIAKEEAPHELPEMERLAQERAKNEAEAYKGPPPAPYPEFDPRVHPGAAFPNLRVPLPQGVIPGAGQPRHPLGQEYGVGDQLDPNRLGPDLSRPAPGRYKRTGTPFMRETGQRDPFDAHGNLRQPRVPRDRAQQDEHVPPPPIPQRKTADQEFSRQEKANLLVKISGLQRDLAAAVALEKSHIGSHERTQQVVAGIQQELAPMKQRVKQLDANAKGMLAGQNRTRQNAGGN